METRELASFGSRLTAATLDTILNAGTLFLAAPLLHQLATLARVPTLGGILLLALHFEAIQTMIWGRTLGHRLCGLLVINAKGERPNYIQAMVRWIMKYILGLLSFITMASRNGKAIHDTVTNTSVVYV